MAQGLVATPAAGEPVPDRATLLRFLVRQRHWQKFETFQVQFARAARWLAEREGEPGLAGATISARSWERWLTGKVKTEPRPDACRVLEHMFGYPVRELLQPAPEASAPLAGEQANQATGVPFTSHSGGPVINQVSTEAIIDAPVPVRTECPNGVHAAGDGIWDVEEMERRELLRLLSGAGLAAPFASGLYPDVLRRRLDSTLNAPTTKSDVAEWERVTAQYSTESGMVPPATLLPQLLTDLDEAQARLQGAPAPLRPPMARVCGFLSALAAMNYFNSGDERSATRYWRTALRLIDQADDRSAQAELRGHRACFFFLEAQPSPSAALALANEAISIDGATPCAGTVIGYSARAQALAILGDDRGSTQTLHDYADAFARVPGAQGSSRSSWGTSEQQLRFIEGFVYAHAGRVPEASQALDAGRSLIPDGQWIAVTSFAVTRGLSLIRGGDPSEGARQIIRAIAAMPAGFRSSGSTRRAALALDAVPASAAKTPAVVQARELLALPPA